MQKQQLYILILSVLKFYLSNVTSTKLTDRYIMHLSFLRCFLVQNVFHVSSVILMYVSRFQLDMPSPYSFIDFPSYYIFLFDSKW